MATYDRPLLDQIQDRVTLSVVIGGAVRLKRHGKEHMGLCPFHAEKTPSFTVNDAKGFYHCFGCGAHGTVFDFLMQQGSLSFPEAVQKAAGLAGVLLPERNQEGPQRSLAVSKTLERLMEDAGLWFQENLMTLGGRTALSYLKNRGLSDEDIRTFGLGYAPQPDKTLQEAFVKKGYSLEDLKTVGLVSVSEESRAVHDRFRGRIMFPIHNPKGQVVGFGGRALKDDQVPKYLNSPETVLFQKGTLLYNYHRAAQSKSQDGPLLIVEGYLDVISMVRAGLPRAVSSMGTALTEAQITLAWRLSPEPCVVMDGDSAGQKAQNRALERALPLLKPNHTLTFLDLPHNQDPDSYIRKAGKQGFLQLLAYKRSLFDQLWNSAYDPSLLKTPEGRALLEGTLYQHIAAIQDRTLQYHYKQDMRARLFSLPRTKAKDAVKPPPLANFEEVQERNLFGILLSYPALLEEVFEEFSRIELTPEVAPLQTALFSYVASQKPLEKDLVIAYLKEAGFDSFLNSLPLSLTQQPLLFQKLENVESARTAFHAICETLLRKGWKKEKQKAQQALKENFTEEAWKRYQALRRQEHENQDM